MPDRPMNIMKSRCACGSVEYEAIGTPITSAICYCASCQEAGRAFEQLPAAPPVLEPDGGTATVLYRKDRVRCVKAPRTSQGVSPQARVANPRRRHML